MSAAEPLIVVVCKYFYAGWLTLLLDCVIIKGFAIKGEEFCLTEASQVVCGVDDGPKTDWCVVCDKRATFAGASWDYI